MGSVDDPAPTARPAAEQPTVEQASRRFPGGWILVTLALVLAPLSPLTFYAGGIIAVVTLGLALILARRGFVVRGVVIGASLALVLSIGVTTAWETFVNTSSEVEGEDRVKQRAVQDEFDRAFEQAQQKPGDAQEKNDP